MYLISVHFLERNKSLNTSTNSIGYLVNDHKLERINCK